MLVMKSDLVDYLRMKHNLDVKEEGFDELVETISAECCGTAYCKIKCIADMVVKYRNGEKLGKWQPVDEQW